MYCKVKRQHKQCTFLFFKLDKRKSLFLILRSTFFNVIIVIVFIVSDLAYRDQEGSKFNKYNTKRNVVDMG
jgi:hypothetical protein